MKNNKAVTEEILRIKELVEEVIQECIEVADENHYERAWVLDRFRARFNSAKRKEREN